MIRSPRQSWNPIAVVLIALVALTTVSCVAPKRSPNLPRIFAKASERTGKTPIIVIPGVLGSQLIDPATGRVVWPSTDRSKEDDIELPITPDLPSNRDALVATRVIDSTRLSLLLPEVRIYSDLLITLQETAGYQLGSIDAPPTGGDVDTFYIFAYDWRRDNVENAHLLFDKIAALKASLGRPALKFNIIAHSMGGLIARYYAMYGDRNIDGNPPNWAGGVNINRLLLVGTPNRGAMDALRSIVEGYNYYGGDTKRRGFFNKLDSDLIFSLPALYQLLPFSGEERYVSARLALEPMDLYAVDTWEQYQWSIFARDHQKEVRKRFGPKADERIREERLFLETVLARAKAFHESLELASPIPRPFGMYLFGGDCEPTLRAPLIVTTNGRVRTYFRTGGVRVPGMLVDRDALLNLMFVPGDTRVTRRSLLAEHEEPTGTALFPSRIGIDYAVFACELHGDLPNNGVLQDNILSILVSDTEPQGSPITETRIEP